MKAEMIEKLVYSRLDIFRSNFDKTTSTSNNFDKQWHDSLDFEHYYVYNIFKFKSQILKTHFPPKKQS